MNRRHLIALRIGLFCLLLGVGWSIYKCVLRPSGAFDWDEAAHALPGLAIVHDLQHGDWLDFLYDSYRQVYWSPGHAWLTALAFSVGGVSPIAARLVSLIAFVLAASALYLAALHLAKHHGDVAAIIT